MRSKRFEILENRPVNKDGFIEEWPEVGLIAMDSPYDPKPSIKIENGVIVEFDGKKKEDFDMIDTFIANYGINIENSKLDKLFDAFYRIDKARSRLEGSTGLGLYIVQQTLSQYNSKCFAVNIDNGVLFSFQIKK